MIELVKEAAQRAGGVPALARKIGVSRQALYQWQRIPAEQVAALSRETGLAAHVLRPDLFAANDRGDSEAGYESDFAAWASAQAGHLEAGRFDRLDLVHLSEEIEDLARRERDEIESRLTVLLKHLLKIRFQPDQHTPSWDSTILEQRARIAKRLALSPSLKSYPATVLAAEYTLARREAALETGLPLATFPAACPFAIEDVLDLDFVPTAETGDQSDG